MPLKDSQRKIFIPNWSLSWYHFPSLMLLVSVRNWGSHTASCVHAHALSCCLEKKEVASCQELLMVCWCGVRLSAVHAAVDPGANLPFDCFPVAYLCLLCSEEVISDPAFRNRVWHVFPWHVVTNCILIYEKGNLTEFSQKKKTVFQGLWKSFRNTLQLSFVCVCVLFIYLFF